MFPSLRINSWWFLQRRPPLFEVVCVFFGGFPCPCPCWSFLPASPGWEFSHFPLCTSRCRHFIVLWLIAFASQWFSVTENCELNSCWPQRGKQESGVGVGVGGVESAGAGEVVAFELPLLLRLRLRLLLLRFCTAIWQFHRKIVLVFVAVLCVVCMVCVSVICLKVKLLWNTWYLKYI